MLPAAWKSPDNSASRSQVFAGAIAASSLRRSSESDTFELQQTALVLDAERSVRADAVCGNDAVTRNDEWVAVVCAERPRGALGIRTTGGRRKLAVRDDLAGRDAAQGGRKLELERRVGVQVELDLVEADAFAGKEALEAVDELARNRAGPVSHLSALRRYRRRQRAVGSFPSRVGAWGRFRSPFRPWRGEPRRVETRTGELMPDELRSLEPELAPAPAVGLVDDTRHRHCVQIYNRPGCPPLPASSGRPRPTTSRCASTRRARRSAMNYASASARCSRSKSRSR